MPELKLNPYDYLNTQKMKYSQHYTENELRKAYSYFREIATKRMKRLEQAGFTKGTQYQRLQAMGLPPLKDITTRSELSMRLNQVAFFTSLKSSTVSGIRQIRAERLKQFRGKGFDISEKDYDAFMDFFEGVKRKAGSFYNVEILAKLYNTAARERVSPEKIMLDFSRITRKRQKKAKK